MSHRLQVVVSQELEARIRRAARHENLSQGEWVRRAIRAALSRDEGNRTDPLARLASLGAPTCDLEQMLSEIDSGRA